MKTLRGAVMTAAVLFTCSIPFAGAQSNKVIDQLLEEEQASFSRVLYLVQSAAGEIEEEVTPREAVARFDPASRGIDGGAPDRAITLGEYAQLLLTAFDIRGGIMYSLFPGPRYAAREIEHLGFLIDNGVPGRSVTGSEVLYILRRLRAWKGEQA